MPSLRGGTGAGRGADRSRDGLGGTTSAYAFRELRLTPRRSTRAGERGLEHWRSTRVRERRLGALRLGENAYVYVTEGITAGIILIPNSIFPFR